MRPRHLALALAACGLAACQPQPLSQADQDAIKAVMASFTSAVNADNLNGMVAVFADDAILQANGMPPAVGAAAVRRTWTTLQGQNTAKLTTTVTKVDGEGDLGYATGTYHLVLTGRQSKAELPPEDGKFTVVAQRQADKSWKLVVDAWNSNSGPGIDASASAPARH